MPDEIKSYHELAKKVPSIRELLQVELDGEVFAYKISKTCRICQAPQGLKDLVDDLILYPKGYKEILRLIEPLQQHYALPKHRRISYSSILGHIKNDLPVAKQAMREIAERRAQARGISLLEGKQTLLDVATFLEVIQQKGWEALVNNQISPTLKEAMEASVLLGRIEQEAQENDGGSYQSLLAQHHIILTAIREIVPPDIIDKLAIRMQEMKDSMELGEGNTYSG